MMHCFLKLASVPIKSQVAWLRAQYFLLCWGGRGPGHLRGMQGRTFHPSASMSSGASRSCNPPRGQGGIFFCFPYLFICFTLAAGKGLFSCQAHYYCKMFPITLSKALQQGGGKKKNKPTFKFTIKLQNFLSLDFRKQVEAGFSISLPSAHIHTHHSFKIFLSNFSMKFFVKLKNHASAFSLFIYWSSTTPFQTTSKTSKFYI